MKPKSSPSPSRAFPLATALVALLASPLVSATSLYWDIDGATAGAGGSAPAGAWATSGSTWSTDSSGTSATPAYTTTSTDDLFFSAGSNARGAYTISVTDAQSTRSLTFKSGIATISGTGGDIALGAGQFINVLTNTGNAIIGANTSTIVSGSNGLTKTGFGALTFNGTTQHTFTGGVTVNGGTLLVDNANRGATNNYILPSNSLTLGGGTFRVKGNGTNDFTQTVADLTVNAGGGVITNDPNGASRTGTVNLGAITATAAGGSLQFTRGTGVGTITTTNTNDATGILSSRIVNGVAGATTPEWAINNGSDTVASYTGYNTTLPTSGSSDTTNYSITAGITLAASQSVNSLKIVGSATALALGGNTLTIASGGLLSVGGTAQTISGTAGATRLTAGDGLGSPADLIVHQFNTAGGGLTISAVIGDNTAGSGNTINLVKAGAGYLNLSGINTYTGSTYVNAGIVDFGANTPAGTGANIFVAPGVGVKFTAPSTTLLNRIATTTDEFGIHTGSNSSAAIDFTNHPNAFLAGGYAGNSAKTDNFTGTITPANDTYRIGFTGANGSFGVHSVLDGASNSLIVGGNNLCLTNANTFGGETVIRTGTQLLLAHTLALQNSALNLGAGSDSIAGLFGLSRLHTNLANDKLVTSATLGGLIGSRNLASAYGGAYGNNADELSTTAVRGFTLNPETAESYTYTGVIANFTRDTTLTKTGDGTQLLGGADTYSGETTISNGTLQLGNASALGKGGSAGTSSGATTVASGATLDLNGTTNVVEPIILNGTGVGGNGALVNNSGSAASIAGGIASLQITNGGTYSSAPTVSLSGTGIGATATVQFGLSNASISISGGTGWVVGDLFTTTGGGGSGAVYEVTGVTAGAITSVNIVNAGSGYTTAPTGITKLSRSLTATGTLTLSFNAANFAVGGLTLTDAGSGYDNSTSVSFSAGDAAASVQYSALTLASDSSIGGTGDTTVAAGVAETSGSWSLTKVGPGTLTLSGTNTYSGDTTITGGTLSLGADNTSNDASTVTIDTSGILQLTFAGSDTVNKLFIGATQQPLGTYGHSSTGATNGGQGVGALDARFAAGTGTLNVTSGPGGPGPLDHFAISAISSPQTAGTAITGITITAQDAANQTVTGFTGTVDFGGTGGFTGTSLTFTLGVLSGVSVTPTVAGSNLTFTVTDAGSGKTGSTTITTIQTRYAAWSGGAAADIDTNGDGVENGAAWALNAASPNTNAIGLLPTLDNTTDPTYLLFSYNRSDAANSDPNTSITVEYGNDLIGWTTAVDDNDNVEIVVTPGSPTDAVVVKLKRSTLAPGGELYARLNVVVTP